MQAKLYQSRGIDTSMEVCIVGNRSVTIYSTLRRKLQGV